jgi:tricorn protease
LRLASSALLAAVLSAPLAFAAPPAHPHLLQRPALTKTQIVFNYAGDLWTVDRNGGRASRLTVGVGIETSPIVSPDGQTIAFSGEYDGNTDVFTIPIGGGVPRRVTYHPAVDVPVAWTPDGLKIIFRSNRDASSRYTQLYEVSPNGGAATLMPLPLAYQGELSPDGKFLAYEPIALPFGFNYASYVAWGNYHGGQAGTINVTNMADLATVTIPHEKSSDFAPVWFNGKVYFLSNRKGPTSIFCYDPGSKAVTEVMHNSGSDFHSLAAGPGGLIYDQFGEIYIFDPASGKSKMISINVDADLPEVRDHIETVSDQILAAHISSTGLRAVFEAHGEILTVPAKKGPTRDLTNTPGVMERDPVWSPDGQSIAYFSDESGLYAVHVSSQISQGTVKKFPLAPEPAYYFHPRWSPDSKLLAFYDNRLNLWMLDTTTSKLTRVGEPNTFSEIAHDYAWSPDSKWLAFTRVMSNHMYAMYLYSVASGQAALVTDQMADMRFPAFDRNGKYLYFTASVNEGGAAFGLDMTSDLIRANRSIYAMVLASDGTSPLAPESDDEKTVAEARERNRDTGDEPTPGEGTRPEGAQAAGAGRRGGNNPAVPTNTPTRIDLGGIQSRIVALPLPASQYADLQSGRAGGFFFLERAGEGGRGGGGGATLKHWSLDTRRADTIAERVAAYDVSANGEKILLTQPRAGAGEGAEGGSPTRGAATYSIVNATPGTGGAGAGGAAAAGAARGAAGESSTLNLADMQVRVDPHAEWMQMYHEVWRIERAYFYDPNFHGVNTVADEKKFEPYVESIASRTDLNYIFQEMLSGFSVGHLRGNGGQIPEAKRIPGGLLGADYKIIDNHYCIAKLYDGGHWNPEAIGPLTQPGLNVKVGDCILAVGGKDLTANDDIQRPLEGTAGHAVTIKLGSGGSSRDITVVPIRSEANLRNIAWIEGNMKKVDELSGGKLAYVYLPDTAQGGFNNFNRYYFAQQEKEGAIIDERFNSGGQVADYIIQAMQRQLMSYWSPRYGKIDHTPNAAIYGPKVMITNEFAGSGGDAMPYLFRQQKIGPLVGKRTWGGLVGIGSYPQLMDGGSVTSPSFGQFSPAGEWDVENRGIEPDFQVEQDPKLVSEGHDPQLEKAVALALEALAKNPPPEPHRPPYPNYHKQ